MKGNETTNPVTSVINQSNSSHQNFEGDWSNPVLGYCLLAYVYIVIIMVNNKMKSDVRAQQSRLSDCPGQVNFEVGQVNVASHLSGGASKFFTKTPVHEIIQIQIVNKTLHQ